MSRCLLTGTAKCKFVRIFQISKVKASERPDAALHAANIAVGMKNPKTLKPFRHSYTDVSISFVGKRDGEERSSACRLKFNVFCHVDPSGVHKLLFEVAAKVSGSALLVFSEAQAERNGISSIRYTAGSQYTASHFQQTDRYSGNSSIRRINTQRCNLQVRSNNIYLRPMMLIYWEKIYIR